MLDKMLVQGMVASNRKVNFCMNCAEAKQARRAKNTHDTSTYFYSAPTDEPGATLCVDLKTDMTPDRLGHKHILTIVDHATNFNRVNLLHKKSDADGHLEAFVNEFERQHDITVKVLRSDGGGEFGSAGLDRFL
ncbi:unnamed protein product [Phytophthora lilii]|uniref:Unnamed protein product n=1 Tax=Phytophthora lilii TaxID=2077276 RepID=A0A9W6XLY2_9STRA|nr:unnamed protein product [Phytophthora lilii]